MGLIEQLRQIQEENGWTDGVMAAKIGVSISMWWQVKNGNFIPGRKFIQGVLQHFPALAGAVLIFLQSDMSSTKVDVSEVKTNG